MPATEFRREVRTESRGGSNWCERWLLHGPEGVVQFLCAIHVTGTDDTWSGRRANVTAYDLGYHWPTPRYEDQSQMTCDLIPGQPECYYDGSSLNAEPVLDVLLSDGDEAVWKYLEDYYEELTRDAVGGFGAIVSALSSALKDES